MKIEKIIEKVKIIFDFWEQENNDWTEYREIRNITISALEKQNPQNPKIKGILFYSYHMYGKCPYCKEEVEEGWRFCPWCGQALNWGDDDD